MWLTYLLLITHIDTKSVFLKIITNTKDPKFSSTKVEIYQTNISKADIVSKNIVNVNSC